MVEAVPCVIQRFGFLGEFRLKLIGLLEANIWKAVQNLKFCFSAEFEKETFDVISREHSPLVDCWHVWLDVTCLGGNSLSKSTMRFPFSM